MTGHQSKEATGRYFSSIWCLVEMLGEEPSRGVAQASVTWSSVLTPGPGLSLLWMCPGRKGGYRLLEHSPDVSRRLATEAGFVDAALFF